MTVTWSHTKLFSIDWESHWYNQNVHTMLYDRENYQRLEILRFYSLSVEHHQVYAYSCRQWQEQRCYSFYRVAWNIYLYFCHFSAVPVLQGCRLMYILLVLFSQSLGHSNGALSFNSNLDKIFSNQRFVVFDTQLFLSFNKPKWCLPSDLEIVHQLIWAVSI